MFHFTLVEGGRRYLDRGKEDRWISMRSGKGKEKQRVEGRRRKG
jgi:hypothetical protein